MKGREALRHLAYGDIPQERKDGFDVEISRRNVQVSYAMLPLMLAFELYNIWRVFFLSEGLTTPANRCYFALYVLLALFSAAGLGVALTARRKVENHTRLILGFTFAYLVFICLFGTGITLLDLRRTVDLMTYSNIVIGVSIFFYIRPWQQLLLLAGNHVLLWACIACLRPEAVNDAGALINSTFLVIVAIAMGMTRYYGRALDYKNRVLISEQNDKITQINAQLAEQVVTDTLSGLYNRRFLDKQLAQEWEDSARAGCCAALIMIDVDNFKNFNDEYGHQAGDECIRRIAGVMTDAIDHRTDYVVRYGGEEFAAVLFEATRERASAVAEDIRSRVEALGIENRHAPTGEVLTVSEGVCWAPLGAESRLDEYLSRADKALYRAKKQGKNRVVTCDSVRTEARTPTGEREGDVQCSRC